MNCRLIYDGRRRGRELYAINWVMCFTEICEDWFKMKAEVDLDRQAESVEWVEGSSCPCCQRTIVGLKCQ